MSGSATHYATTRPAERKYRVIFDGRAILETGSAVELREHYDGRDFDPVIYFPADAIAGLETSASARVTHCPIKGDASYLNYRAVADALWCYRDPRDEVEAIRDHYAFDQSKGFRVLAADAAG